LVLIIWNIWTIWPEISHEIAISYTAFVSQIKAENVKDVQIDGAQISGTFQQGLPASDLVPPEQLATPEATPQSASTPQTTAVPELFYLFYNHFPRSRRGPELD
jgi:hypothetical protein